MNLAQKKLTSGELSDDDFAAGVTCLEFALTLLEFILCNSWNKLQKMCAFLLQHQNYTVFISTGLVLLLH